MVGIGPHSSFVEYYMYFMQQQKDNKLLKYVVFQKQIQKYRKQ